MPITIRHMPAAGLLLLAACQTPVAQSTNSATNPAEVQFTANAFQIIQFDQKEGALAQTQARDPRVKTLAQQLTNEANEFAARLGPVASAAGIKPPTELRNDLRIRLGHMQLQQGLDFDRTYLTDQIASHEEATMMQDSMSGASVSPQFATLVQQGQAIIRRNLDTLRALQAQMDARRR